MLGLAAGALGRRLLLTNLIPCLKYIHQQPTLIWPVASVSVEAVARSGTALARRPTEAATAACSSGPPCTPPAGLMQNKNGKVVSKARHAFGKRQYKNIRGWTQAVSKARKALGITGFCAVKKGTPLYAKAREFYN